MSPASAQPLSQRRKLVIYVSVLAGMFMASLDMQIIATALPTIANELGNLELFGWVGAAYVLATAAVTPFYGKFGDMFGRKRVFMTAVALFLVGSLACGLAWSMETLIAARILQGLGGGGLMTSAFAVIADLFEPRERARYQGYSSAVFTLSNLVGPVAGGVIAENWGWQYIFLINVPIGVVLLVILALAMPATAPVGRRQVDYLGGLLLAAAVTGLVFWAEDGFGQGEHAVQALTLLALAIAALIGFIFVERRAAEPILPLHLFANRTIVTTLLMSIIVGVATLGMLNYFALFLQVVTGLSPALAGLLFLPSSVGSLMASILAGMVTARTGRYKIFPILGTAIGVVSMLLFAMVDAQTPYWWIGALMFLFSVSLGLQIQTLVVALQAAAPRKDVGAATGALTLSRTIGASLGLAANAGILAAALAWAQNGLAPEIAQRLPMPLSQLTPAAIGALPSDLAPIVVEQVGHAFVSVFHFAAVLFAISFVLALTLKDVRLPTTGTATMQPAAGE